MIVIVSILMALNILVDDIILRIILGILGIILIMYSSKYLHILNITKTGKDFFDNLYDAVLITNKDNKILYANQAFIEMVGYSYDEIKDKNPSMFKSGYHDRKFYQAMWEAIKRDGFWEGEVIYRKKNGNIFIKKTRIVVKRGMNNKAKYFFSVQKNVNYLSGVEMDKDRYQYYYFDTLLPNERHLVENLDKRLETECEKCRLLYCQIINNLQLETKHGKNRYLEMLIEFHNRVKNVIGDKGLSAEVNKNEKADREVVKSILMSAQNIFDNDELISLDVRMGLSKYEKGLVAVDLISRAYLALNKVLDSKEGIYLIYDPSFSKDVEDEYELNLKLKEAINNKKLMIYYQPQVSVDYNKLVGAEALIRWHDDKKGFIAPDKFLPIALKSGYMQDIDDYVIEKVFSDFEMIRNAKGNIDLSINISQKNFITERFKKVIVNLLDKYNVNPNSIILEVLIQLG